MAVWERPMGLVGVQTAHSRGQMAVWCRKSSELPPHAAAVGFWPQRISFFSLFAGEGSRVIPSRCSRGGSAVCGGALLGSAVGLLRSLRRWIRVIATEEWLLLPVPNPQHCSAVGGVCSLLAVEELGAYSVYVNAEEGEEGKVRISSPMGHMCYSLPLCVRWKAFGFSLLCKPHFGGKALSQG